MICTQCGREIPDGSLSCNYCGKIFVSRRPSANPASQAVPLNSTNNRSQAGSNVSMNQAINSAKASAPSSPSDLARAVSLRRLQRYFFYGILSAVIIGCIFFAVKVYNDNIKLVVDLNGLNAKLETSQKEIDNLSSDVAAKSDKIISSGNELQDARSSLAKVNESLAKAIEENKSISDKLKTTETEATATAADLTKAKATLKNIITETALKITATDLARIQVATIENDGQVDTDKDGLSDNLEAVFKTDPLKVDTDGDGYNDLDELNKGFNPTGAGKVEVDQKIINKYKGRLVLSQHNNGYYGWYVGLNGKRYFLGSSADDYAVMRSNSYWSTAK